MQAGSEGQRIEELPEAGWDVADTYGLPTNLDSAGAYANAIAAGSPECPASQQLKPIIDCRLPNTAAEQAGIQPQNPAARLEHRVVEPTAAFEEPVRSRERRPSGSEDAMLRHVNGWPFSTAKRSSANVDSGSE